MGPAGIRGSGLGWQPATHRLAQSGGVSGPWRGAWNTPCRKRHVTMTLQKSRAVGNKGQLSGRLAGAGVGVGVGTAGTAPTGAHAAPQYLWTASWGTWGMAVQGGSWDVGAEARALESVNSRRGRGRHVGFRSIHDRLRSSSPSGRLPFLSRKTWEDNCPCTIISLRLGGLSEGLPRKRCLMGGTLAPVSQTSSEFGSINCY